MTSEPQLCYTFTSPNLSSGPEVGHGQGALGKMIDQGRLQGEGFSACALYIFLKGIKEKIE